MPQQEYCTALDLGRFGMKAEALEVVQVKDGQTPPIQSASARIDGYLAQGGYVLPLVSWGEDLRECAAVLAAWTIYGTRKARVGENPEESTLYLRWKDWIRWLERIADGKLAPPGIVDTPVVDPVQAQAGRPRIRSNESRIEGSAFAGARRSGRTG